SGLGGILLGRRADRTKRPLRLYGLLEAGIAVTALLVPLGFTWLTAVYTTIYAALQPGVWVGTCIRFMLALLVLLVPTTLIGGTLPVMGRLASRRGSGLPASFSMLYGINTLGAVLGAALTGFVLLHCLGMQKTLWLAAGINLAVGLIAGLCARGASTLLDGSALEPHGISPANAPLTGSSAVSKGWLMVSCAVCTGANGLGFEVAWTRILGIFTSNSAYAFALVLSVMLFGLGVGSLLQAWWSRKQGDGWQRLAVCQWLLVSVTLGSLAVLRKGPTWLDRWCDGTSTPAVFLGELALTASVLFLPAVLMGMSFPLLAATRTGQASPVGRWLGTIYAANTLGGVAGAFLTGFV